MNFEHEMFEWQNEGVEPSNSLKQSGFQGGYKPAAATFNNFWYKVTNAIRELQTKLSGHAEDKSVHINKDDNGFYIET